MIAVVISVPSLLFLIQEYYLFLLIVYNQNFFYGFYNTFVYAFIFMLYITRRKKIKHINSMFMFIDFFAFIFTCFVVITFMFCYYLYALLCMKYYFFGFLLNCSLVLCFLFSISLYLSYLLTMDYTHISSKPMLTKLPHLHLQRSLFIITC